MPVCGLGALPGSVECQRFSMTNVTIILIYTQNRLRLRYRETALPGFSC